MVKHSIRPQLGIGSSYRSKIVFDFSELHWRCVVFFDILIFSHGSHVRSVCPKYDCHIFTYVQNGSIQRWEALQMSATINETP